METHTATDDIRHTQTVLGLFCCYIYFIGITLFLSTSRKYLLLLQSLEAVVGENDESL